VTVAALEPPVSFPEREHQARALVAPIAALFPFAPRFHDHGGVVQHYVDEGPRSAETLLFLHGNPTWSFAWRRSILALSDRWRCVAPDHVGMGLSDKPRDYPYRLERHVENLERLVLALDLEAITLVMHDWGGPIGMGFARRHPGRVRALVVSNTAAFRARRLPLRLAACRVPFLGTLAIQGFNAFVRGAAHMAVEKRLQGDVRAGYALPYHGWTNRGATRAFVEDIPLAPGHPSHAELSVIEAALPTFADRPVALLWGERDWCFGPAFLEEWRRRFPHASVRCFEEAGHWVFEDEPAGYVEALEDFLEGSAER